MGHHMKIVDVKKLVMLGESSTLEFKKSTGQLHAAMESVCAFLNSVEGGVVLIGVTDEGSIIGQEIVDKNRRDIANELEKIEPHADVEVAYVLTGEGKARRYVVALKVKSGRGKPYVYDDRPFVRNQSTTQRMSREHYEQLLQNSQRPSLSWESLTHNKCAINDLDKKRIKQVVSMAISRGRLSEEAANANIGEILHKFELFYNDHLTNAAVVLFCKSEQKQFIQSAVQLARFDGLTKSVFIDRKDLRGNVFDLFEGTMKFLQFTLPIAGEVVEDSPYRVDTPAVPYKALREGILNALVHRDYSMRGGSIDIAIYNDRVEIDSPGSLPAGMDLKSLTKKHKSIRRNPLIAHVLYASGMIEKWGRGTLDMIELCKNSGNPSPRFEETVGSFSVVFPLKQPIARSKPESISVMPLTDRQKEILEILRGGGGNSQQIVEKINVPVTQRTIQRELSKLKELGLVTQKKVGMFIVWTMAEK